MSKVSLFVVVALVGACDDPLSLGRAPLTGVDAASSCGTVSYQGCCVGQTLVYCASGKLVTKPCAPGLCGWNQVFGIYECGLSDASDPTGAAPRSCPPIDAGTMDLQVDGFVFVDSAPVEGGAGCGALGFVGCCSGSTLVFCVAGQILSQSCQSAPACGWNALKGLYDCNTPGLPDPSGKHPLSCSAVTGDAGLPPLDSGGAVDQGQDVVPGEGLTEAGVDATTEDQTVVKDGNITSEGVTAEDHGSPADGPSPEVIGLDASGLDAGQQGDAKQVRPSGGGGCSGCRVTANGGLSSLTWLMLAFVVVAIARRKGQV